MQQVNYIKLVQMESKENKLAYWKTRGLIEPIKMVMEYLHVKYKDVEYELDFLQPLNVSTAEWKDIKEALEKDTTKIVAIGNVSVVHTIGICKYLAQKFRPKMLGSAMNQYAEVDAVLYMCHDMSSKLIEGYDQEKCSEETMRFVKEKLKYINKYIRSKSWVSGTQATVADFVLCELIEFVQSLDSTTLDTYPNCRKLLRKLYCIPEIARYKANEVGFDIAKYIKAPFKEEP